MRSNSSGESPMLSGTRRPVVQLIGLRGAVRATDAARKSARSPYCQYSRLGIGSSREAGRERRLRWNGRLSLTVGMGALAQTDRLATSPTPMSLGRRSASALARYWIRWMTARLPGRCPLLEQPQNHLDLALLARDARLGDRSGRSIVVGQYDGDCRRR